MPRVKAEEPIPVFNAWKVYEYHTDSITTYAARRFQVDKYTGDVFAHHDYKKIVRWIIAEAAKYGLRPTKFEREPEDDPIIKETWL